MSKRTARPKNIRCWHWWRDRHPYDASKTGVEEEPERWKQHCQSCCDKQVDNDGKWLMSRDK